MKKPPTKAESAHMARVAELGCLPCRNNGFPNTPAECHHIRHQVGVGRRSSHYETIPLCDFHHRNGNYGEAIHAGKAAWEERFGTELQLLEQTRELLK